ncbi:MAG: FtsQ-type POTRA domain-containing protein [Dehalococcoidia bacterium]|nr:MAG: FtsQ-type POTRA domain-containing protein [Dehalococcoidia bacterium]
MLVHDLFRNLQWPGRRPSRRPGTRRPSLGEARYGVSPRRFETSRGEPRRARPTRPPVSRRGLGLIAGAAAAMMLTGAGGWWVFSGDVVRVQQVRVTGAEVVSADEIARIAGLQGRSMLGLDTGLASEAVRALPSVKDVQITRDWLHTVTVDVTEHQAFGYWQSGSQRIVVDEEGHALQASRPAPHTAPTIVELGADVSKGVAADTDTVRLVARLLRDGTFARVGHQPKAFLFRADRGLTVIAEGQPDVIFGDSSNYEFKVQSWTALAERLKREPPKETVQEIDLRFGRNIVLRGPAPQTATPGPLRPTPATPSVTPTSTPGPGTPTPQGGTVRPASTPAAGGSPAPGGATSVGGR